MIRTLIIVCFAVVSVGLLLFQLTRTTRTDDFLQAGIRGDLRVITRMLKEGIPADDLAEDDSTALYFAAGNGHIEVVKALLEAGADPSHKNMIGESALTVSHDPRIKKLLTEYAAKRARPTGEPGRRGHS